MAIFSCNGTVSTLDSVLNGTYGVILPFIFVLSLVLNPVIFIYNCKQRSSVGSMLFQMLAVSDFITCLYQPIVLLVALWDAPSTAEPRPPTPIRLVSTLVMGSVVFGSGMITNVLSITRYIKIRYPFVKISRTRVGVGVVASLVAFDGAMAVILLSSDSQHFDRRIQLVWYDIDTWSILLIMIFGAQSLLATITSIATVYELRKSIRAQDRSIGTNTNKTRTEKIKLRLASQQRSGLTILIMSSGNMALVVFGCLYSYIKVTDMDKVPCPSYQNKLYNFTVFNLLGFIPIFLSAVNPLIVLVRSKGIREMLAGEGTVQDRDTTNVGRSTHHQVQTVPPPRQYLRSVSAPADRAPRYSSLLVVQNFSALVSVSTSSVLPENVPRSGTPEKVVLPLPRCVTPDHMTLPHSVTPDHMTLPHSVTPDHMTLPHSVTQDHVTPGGLSVTPGGLGVTPGGLSVTAVTRSVTPPPPRLVMPVSRQRSVSVPN